MRTDPGSPESRQAGFYEIALSNRQLFAVFLLLGLLFASAFLLGVWFARESLGPRVAAPAVAAPPPVAPTAVDDLEEFKFFSEEKPPAAATANPSPPPPRPTPPQTTPGSAAANGSTGSSAPAIALNPARPATGSAASRPEASRPETNGPATSVPAASVPAASAGALHVQVFSSADAAQSRRVLGQLKQAGYTAFISPIQVDKRTMHRVRIGPFGDREKAQKVADQVRSRFRLSTWITAY